MPPQKKRTKHKTDRHGPPQEEAVTIEQWIDRSIYDLNCVRRLYMRWRNMSYGQELLSERLQGQLRENNAKLSLATEVLKKIASCRSTIEGDVVDIAQKALKEIE